MCNRIEANNYEISNFDLDKINEKKLVIYKSLYDNAVAYARPYKMFLSEVDKEKYPNATQEYRLEEVPLEDVLEI